MDPHGANRHGCRCVKCVHNIKQPGQSRSDWPAIVVNCRNHTATGRAKLVHACDRLGTTTAGSPWLRPLRMLSWCTHVRCLPVLKATACPRTPVCRVGQHRTQYALLLGGGWLTRACESGLFGWLWRCFDDWGNMLRPAPWQSYGWCHATATRRFPRGGQEVSLCGDVTCTVQL